MICWTRLCANNTARTHIPYYTGLWKIKNRFPPTLVPPVPAQEIRFCLCITVYYDCVYMCDCANTRAKFFLWFLSYIPSENTYTHRTQKCIAGLPLSRLMIHCRECTHIITIFPACGYNRIPPYTYTAYYGLAKRRRCFVSTTKYTMSMSV
jgi:hypothetical protein